MTSPLHLILTNHPSLQYQDHNPPHPNPTTSPTMKPTLIISSLLAFLLPTASADCFTSGESWADRGNAAFHAQRACSGYDGKQGVFQGTFPPFQTRRVCVQYSARQRFDFTVRNQDPRRDLDIPDEDCTFLLTREINACEKGGRGRSSDWEVT